MYNLFVIDTMRRQLINFNSGIKEPTAAKPVSSLPEPIKQFVNCNVNLTAVNNEYYPEVYNIYKDIDGYNIVYTCRNCGQTSAISYVYCPYCGTKPNNNIYTYVDEKLYNVWKEDKVKAQLYIMEKNMCRLGNEPDTLTYNI